MRTKLSKILLSVLVIVYLAAPNVFAVVAGTAHDLSPDQGCEFFQHLSFWKYCCKGVGSCHDYKVLI